MKLIIFILISISSVLYPFSYDSAIYAAQKGDIKNADEQMRSILVNSPDDADVLYDAGVLAHQLNNATQAAAYFARSANCAHDDKDLCFRAHFNAGNAYVDIKDLKAALSEYEAALQIDPDNEYARHNRDRVKQMLQEQEQQQNQQSDKNKQQDDQDKEQNDEQDDKGEQNDQKQSGNENNQQQKNDQQQDQDNNSENGSDQKSQGDKGESSKKDSDREQGKQQRDTDKHDQDSSQNKERNGDQGLDDKSQGTQDKQQKEQQGEGHGKTPEQEKTNDKNSIASQSKPEQASVETDEETETDKFAEKIQDPWLLSVLNEQEAHDKEVNKKLMEARIRQHGGKNGQNCW